MALRLKMIQHEAVVVMEIRLQFLVTGDRALKEKLILENFIVFHGNNHQER